MRIAKVVPVSVVLAAVALAALYGPIIASIVKRLPALLSTESEAGSVRVEPGDRYAEVAFAVPFSSAPVVTLTPEIMASGLSFAVTRVDGSAFRVELSDPAPAMLAFAWTATWNVGFEIEDAEDRGLPSQLTARIDGTRIRVMLEAYRDSQPVALLVPASSLEDLADTDDENIATAALAAARESFDDTFTCSWLERLRFRLYARVALCPAWGVSPTASTPEWQEAGDWSVARTDRGLEIALPSNPPAAAVDRAAAVSAWSDLLRDSSSVDLARHNNQVLDFVDELTTEAVLDPSQRLTIIHLDTHSDLHTYPDPAVVTDREDISDFMNRLAQDGRLAEVYWVLPDWTRDPDYRAKYWEESLPNEPLSYVEGPGVLDIFADRQERLLYFGAPPADGAETSSVRFHKVLLSELPSFEGRSDVYLEVDGDYFSNTGFDTALQAHANPTREEMFANIASVAETLRARGVRPLIASWCLSPSYTAPEDELDQERFVLDVLRASAKEDYLLGYRHQDETGVQSRARTLRRDTPLGRLLLELRESDLRRPNGDRNIELHGEELADSLGITSRALEIDDRSSRALLRKLDRFDGRLDGSIDLVSVEYYAAVDDLERLVETADGG